MKYLQMVAGVLFLTLAFNLFFLPNQVVAGGISGLAVILESNYDVNPATFVFVINLILLVLGYKILGRTFALKTVISANILFPLFLVIIPVVELTSDQLLAVIMGGFLTGIGIAMLFYSESSTGGTVTMGKIFNKYTSVNFSVSVALMDIVIVAIGTFTFGIEATFYAIVAITVMVLVSNYLETGLKRSRVLYIVSDEYEKINSVIMEKIPRGTTLLDAQGGYTKKEKKVIMCVLNKKEVVQIERKIYEIDSKAFIFTNEVGSTYGEGFDNYSISS